MKGEPLQLFDLPALPAPESRHWNHRRVNICGGLTSPSGPLTGSLAALRRGSLRAVSGGRDPVWFSV